MQMNWFRNNSHRPKLVRMAIVILILSGMIVLNRKLDFKKLKEVHTELEKKIGDVKVNEQLYGYNDLHPINKLIVTDYSYLSILPGLSKFLKHGEIQILRPTDPVFTNETVGFLLMSPLFNTSSVLPDFIEEKIKTGEYVEIFNFNGYRFIKIR